jgi:hypothetical protein
MALLNFINIAQVQILGMFFVTTRIYYMVGKQDVMDTCRKMDELGLLIGGLNIFGQAR